MDDEFEAEYKATSGANPNAWMLTFADLLSLVLTFFVMLYATQQVEQKKWQEMVESFSERLNPNRDQPEIQTIRKTHSQVEEPVAINLDYLQAVLNEKFVDIPEFSTNRIKRMDDRLVISFPTEGMFEAYTVNLSYNAKLEIDKLAGVLGSIGNRIEVASYVPESETSAEDMGWLLTLRHSSLVADEFRRAGYFYAVTAYGLGSSRASVNAGKLPPHSAYSDSSRVDIVVREMTATE